MRTALYPWPIVLLGSLLSDATRATASLSTAVLHESCRAYAEAPESDEAVLCSSYIQGYLDSARSGAQLETRRAGDQPPKETWAERAARTRLGKSHLETLRDRDLRFCVDESVDLPDIISHLLEYLHLNPPDLQRRAADDLLRTLVLHYPCGP